MSRNGEEKTKNRKTRIIRMKNHITKKTQNYSGLSSNADDIRFFFLRGADAGSVSCKCFLGELSITLGLENTAADASRLLDVLLARDNILFMEWLVFKELLELRRGGDAE